MQHVDEGTIHAWLDGALAPDESERVASHVASCGACGAVVADARGLVAAASRILSALDVVPPGVMPGRSPMPGEHDPLAALRARHRQAPHRPWWRAPQFLAAASVMFIAGTATVVWRSGVEGTGAESPAPATTTAESDRRTEPERLGGQADAPGPLDAVVRRDTPAGAPASTGAVDSPGVTRAEIASVALRLAEVRAPAPLSSPANQAAGQQVGGAPVQQQAAQEAAKAQAQPAAPSAGTPLPSQGWLDSVTRESRLDATATRLAAAARQSPMTD